jgi:hypothetical protein
MSPQPSIPVTDADAVRAFRTFYHSSAHELTDAEILARYPFLCADLRAALAEFLEYALPAWDARVEQAVETARQESAA